MGSYLTSFIKLDYIWKDESIKFKKKRKYKVKGRKLGDYLCQVSRVKGFHKQDTEYRHQKVKKLIDG